MHSCEFINGLVNIVDHMSGLAGIQTGIWFGEPGKFSDDFLGAVVVSVGTLSDDPCGGGGGAGELAGWLAGPGEPWGGTGGAGDVFASVAVVLFGSSGFSSCSKSAHLGGVGGIQLLFQQITGTGAVGQESMHKVIPLRPPDVEHVGPM